MGGLLIVNSDDFGFSRSVTDAVLEAHAAGGLSSATAMVWMRDTERAADRGRDVGLATGLHLNLTFPYEGADVPAGARERQLALTARFTAASWHDGAPRLRRRERRLLQDVVRDQMSRFFDVFGEPTHLDSHHHVHVHANVLDVLPARMRIRPVISTPADADRPLDRRARRIRRHFRGAATVVDLRHVHPDLGGVGLQALERSRGEVLEIMCHAREPDELAALTAGPWTAALARLPFGSYADLDV